MLIVHFEVLRNVLNDLTKVHLSYKLDLIFHHQSALIVLLVSYQFSVLCVEGFYTAQLFNSPFNRLCHVAFFFY